MVLADDISQRGGVDAAAIGAAFAGHGIALGARALLAPELALAAGHPGSRRSPPPCSEKTIAEDCAGAWATGSGPVSVCRPDVDDTTVAKVSSGSRCSSTRSTTACVG